MKLLIDNNPRRIARLQERYTFIGGQLLTPLTRNSDAGGAYGIDNGAFSGFREPAWRRLLVRQLEAQGRCLFVTVPDIVGAARRSVELFNCFACDGDMAEWPLALAAQDGLEDVDIPWAQVQALFIGGSTEWKMSKAAADVVNAAKILRKHVHVGRINTPDRWKHFESLGADTCDGSGVSRFDWMLDEIQAMLDTGAHHPLFPADCGGDSVRDVGESDSPRNGLVPLADGLLGSGQAIDGVDRQEA